MSRRADCPLKWQGGGNAKRDARAVARALHDTVAGNLFRRATLFRTGNRYETSPRL